MNGTPNKVLFAKAYLDDIVVFSDLNQNIMIT